MNTLDARDRATETLGMPTVLADALVLLALCEGRPAPGWDEVRGHLSTHRALPPDDAETLILDGLRADDARAVLSEEATWVLRVRPAAARVVLLRYAAGRLDDAGRSIETAHDYEGPDRLLVLSMLVELIAFSRGDTPPPRPATYRRFLDA